MYTPTIGLEIHAELDTVTKMFCDCANDADAVRPNVNVCPVCMAHPGTLPTINKKAVQHVLRVGCAVEGVLADYSEFDRKNYFYPDLPKGYQISQYEFPLVSGGELDGVLLTRIHLEEDTARAVHTNDSQHSHIDFNRAGVPLMELVTEPVVHSAAQASHFARELQLLLRYLGVSEANMEKGQMRVEANISVAQPQGKLGTKVEVKNLNSFRSVERAIHFEIRRQTELLEGGETVVQETRGWNEQKQCTYSQRIKEEAADYRYFPDPDLPKLKLSEVSEFARENLIKTLPELPQARRVRFVEAYALTPEDTEVLVTDSILGEFFEQVVDAVIKQKSGVPPKLLANYLLNDVRALKHPHGAHVTTNLDPGIVAEIIGYAHAKEISSNAAVTLLTYIVAHAGEKVSVRAVAEEQGLLQESNKDALRDIITTVLKEHEQAVVEYQSGKEQALQFLVGQGMKISKGSANPSTLKELIREAIG